jgi:hypothetical protein
MSSELVSYLYALGGAVNSVSPGIHPFPQYTSTPVTTVNGVFMAPVRIPADVWDSNSTLVNSNPAAAENVDQVNVNLGAAEDYLCWMNDPALHGQGDIWLGYAFDTNGNENYGLVTMIHLRCCNGRRGTNARIQVTKDIDFATAVWTTLHVVDNAKWTASQPVIGSPHTFEDYVVAVPVTSASEWWKMTRIVFDDNSVCSYDLFALCGVKQDN